MPPVYRHHHSPEHPLRDPRVVAITYTQPRVQRIEYAVMVAGRLRC